MSWHIQCYHIKVEHYTTTETDSEGRSRQVSKTRETRHNTWSAAGSYVPHYWEDISSPFPDLGDNALTRLTFSKKMVFADQASENHFREAKMHFINTNNRDQHMDFSESFNVTGFKKHVLACKGADAVPGWLGRCVFYLATLFCLTVPYRIAFAIVSWEIPKYHYIKRCYSANSPAVLPSPVPVVTTCTVVLNATAVAVPAMENMPVAVAVPVAATISNPLVTEKR